MDGDADGVLRTPARAPRPVQDLSLWRLLEPSVLAEPYPLYRRLREHDPVFWDPFLHAWVVTDYANVQTVLYRFSAERTPTPSQLSALGLGILEPVAEIMIRQMLFMDAPAHTRLRGLCAAGFSARRVDGMRMRIQNIADTLLDRVAHQGHSDIMADFANPLPAMVTAELLGVPTTDHEMLKSWSATFAEMLGNFQHNPDRAERVLNSVRDMLSYFRSAIREQRHRPTPGLIHALMTADLQGARLTEDDLVANVIVTMVGGQETTTNLIGNGLLTLMNHPAAMAQLREHPEIIETAVEELLRFESPSQHTARLVPEDTTLGGKALRNDNRHMAFGWAAHFCFGAPLARLEGQIAFNTLLRRLPNLAVADAPLVWRENLGLRGLTALHVNFEACNTTP
jgi:cytochrome P450